MRALLAAAILSVGCGLGRLVDGFRPESRVLAAIRTIHVVQAEYFSQYRHYALTLRELAPLLDDNSVSDISGFRLTLTGTQSGYVVSAMPKVFRPGSRTFYSDQTMVVHEHFGPEQATLQDPELK
jgi:hypothetical protein